MRQLLNITRRDAIEIASGFGKIGAAAITSIAANKALKITADSLANTVTNIKNTIRNS